MDKTWMDLPRSSLEYREGVKYFLNFALMNSQNGLILCPCKKCKNAKCRQPDVVEGHLLWAGFLDGYTKWVLHGELYHKGTSPTYSYEGLDTTDNMHDLLNDAFRMPNEANFGRSELPTEIEEPNEEAEKFYRLMKDAEQELYPGCQNFSKLSFIVRMLQIKCLGHWSDSSFTMMLSLLKESFPEGAQLPENYYESKKMMKDLGLHYKKIDACKNDCMLYWGVDENKNKCDTCGESRWKVPEAEVDSFDVSSSKKNAKSKKGKKVPNKIMWHFPLKPRLQRLFMNAKTASLMRWHAEKRPKDGVMRHPADSPAWHTFDYHYPDFAQECRNVRLGLATDGFNPFRTMNVAYSTWPIILMPYNLPPGECMKKSYLMLSILIPGPNQPGNDIDVYLQPLIAELKELWDEGVITYDALCKKNFKLRAALLWTIRDFPGLATVSGWSTKGAYACPVCQKDTNSMWLDGSRKFCYMCHRIFLPRDHPYRKEKGSFNGSEEHRKAPPYLSGSAIYEEIKDFEIKFGKKVGDLNLPYGWKKKSILFELPYWEKNLVRHNLDVMHIEKNVCDKILHTLLDSDKSKDNHKARLDLQNMGIRPGLHPFYDENGREWIPTSSFAFDKNEKETFCKVLKKVKVPDGYAANISRCVQTKPPKIFGLKSHDSHILMQQLLPLSLRKLLPKSIRSPLIHLCRYYRDLCSKSLHHDDLDRMERDIVVILCQLEKIFPPAFFDIMVHLTVHLVTEARLAGPVHYRWMYPIERYLSTLKSYVRNRGHPEGSIAEGYLAEECLAFCSLYLDNHVETRFNGISRNDEGEKDGSQGLQIFSMPGRPLWKGEATVLDRDTLIKAHRYVLFNCEEITSYRDQYEALVRRKKHRSREHDIKRNHSEHFAAWFMDHVQRVDTNEDDPKSVDIKCLAKGPLPVGIRYKGYIVNGFRFHTTEIEKKRKTQNSGVMVNATTTSFASKKDKTPILSEMAYFGILKDIIELDYTNGKKVVLFDCNWVSKGKRLKEDEDGFTLTNFTNIKRQNEPFSFASQVQQVFYVADPFDNDWHVVIKTKAREKFYEDQDLSTDRIENILQSEASTYHHVNEDEGIVWVREGASGIPVDSLD